MLATPKLQVVWSIISFLRYVFKVWCVWKSTLFCTLHLPLTFSTETSFRWRKWWSEIKASPTPQSLNKVVVVSPGCWSDLYCSTSLCSDKPRQDEDAKWLWVKSASNCVYVIHVFNTRIAPLWKSWHVHADTTHLNCLCQNYVYL
jgi:hypothetical protein